MAVVENRFVCDLSKPVQAQALKGNVFSLDNLGSRISVLIYENGQPATISGSVTANCILPDGSTVNVNGGLTTENGGSKAYVDIPQSCLLIPGILKIAIKCTSSSVITTLAAIVANVYMTKTDNVITPSQQIINDWNAEISAAIATQNAAIANQDTKINDLKSAIDDIDGLKIIQLTRGYYITTSGSNVDVTDLHPTPSNIMFYCAYCDCSEGDAFTIKGTGGSGPRLWCFIDSSGDVISNSPASATLNLEVLFAPANASKIVYNSLDSSNLFVKGTLTEKQIADLQMFDDTVEKAIIEQYPNLLSGEDFTVPSIDELSYVYSSATGEITITNNSTASNYPCLQTPQGFLMSKLTAGKKYRFHAKANLVSGAANINIVIRGISGNVNGTYARKQLKSGDEVNLDFVATEYNTYATLFVAFGSPSVSVVKFSDIWIRDEYGITAIDNTARDEIKDISTQYEDNYDASDFTEVSAANMSYTYDSETGVITLTNDSTAQYPALQTNLDMINNLIPGKEYRFHAKAKVVSGNPILNLIIAGTLTSATSGYKRVAFENGECTLDFVAQTYNKKALLSVSFGEVRKSVVQFSNVYIHDKNEVTANDYTARYDIRETQKNEDEPMRMLQSARHFRSAEANKPLTLLHFSDIHKDIAAMKRIVEKSSFYSDLVDDMICTGDIAESFAENISSWWNENILTCIGNHDTATSSGGVTNWTGLSMADRDAYYIAPFEDNWDIVHTEGTSYYYKDYTDAHVRMIVIDCMLYVDGGSAAETQTTWIKNAMDGAKSSGYHILIATHSFHNNSYFIDCSFTQGHSNYGDNLGNATPWDTPQAVVDAVAEKIEEGCVFIGYICGHGHIDWMLDNLNDKTQLSYTITCAATNNPDQWRYSDIYHGKFEDAFNLITIDTTNKYVKIIRGGGGNITNQMTKRKMICFDYSTGEIVGQDE